MHDREQLEHKIRKGDTEALAQYLEQSRDRWLGFLKLITGEHLLQVIELEDLFQEVCRSAITALPRLPLAELDVDRWLQQLARRRVVDTHREHFEASKRAQHRNLPFGSLPANEESSKEGLEHWLVASITSPSMAVSRDWRLARLQAALASLEPDQRTLVQLRYGEGLSSVEIAQQLGKTDSSVRVSLSRILGKLQQLLEKPG